MSTNYERRSDTSLPLSERIAAANDSKRSTLDSFEQRFGETRLAKARVIAMTIFSERGRVTVWEIHDVWNATYGADTWRDDNGRCNWTGAIFRAKGWRRIGTTTSPFNHAGRGDGVWIYEVER